jgi:hypothetical protein
LPVNKNDDAEMRSRYIGLVIGIICLPVLLLFAYFGYPTRGAIFMTLLGVFMAAIYTNKDLCREIYFIITISLLFALHIIAILIIHIPEHTFSYSIALPLAVADFYSIIFLIKIIGKITGA